MAEMRENARRRVFKEGKIILHAGSSVINCVIRDRSDSGARLRLPAATELPSKFGLVVPAEELLYPVQVAWRRNDDIGVEFIGPAKRAPPRKW